MKNLKTIQQHYNKIIVSYYEYQFIISLISNDIYEYIIHIINFYSAKIVEASSDFTSISNIEKEGSSGIPIYFPSITYFTNKDNLFLFLNTKIFSF